MSPSEPIHVLIVDDEPFTASIIEICLEDRFSVVSEMADDCASARQKFSSKPHDVITLDQLLPDGRGLELLREINKMENPPPVIMVTGHGDEDTAVESFRLGASGYVVKNKNLTRILPEAVERALAERKLKDLINAELEAYSQTVSHDLKGPLSNIGMSLDMISSLLETPDRIEDIKKVVGAGRKVVRRALDLVDDMLLLARTGQMPENTFPVSVSRKVEEIIMDKRSEIDEREVVLEIDEDLGEVVADPTHLYQLFGNLVGNAIKYADDESPVVRVSRLEREQGGHRYLVSDNGPGIDEKIIEKIFRPFFKGDGSTGTGIGLAIVDKILKIYHGEVRVYNDQGACFEFTLNNAEKI